MSDRNRTSPPEHQKDPNEQDAAVRDTFPASDPVSGVASTGARAVPPERLLREDDAPHPAGDTVILTQHFRDAEAAKLALETLVREGPIDRHCAEIRHEGEAATVAVQAPRSEAGRIEALLHRQGGAG